jgi:hypothetical protein
MSDIRRGAAVRASDLFTELRRRNPEIAIAEERLGSRYTLARHVLRLRNGR